MIVPALKSESGRRTQWLDRCYLPKIESESESESTQFLTVLDAAWDYGYRDRILQSPSDSLARRRLGLSTISFESHGYSDGWSRCGS